MLSRIAESLFWIGRYLERADSTARILDVQTLVLVEDPGWYLVCGLLRAQGHSLPQIAQELTAAGYRTRRGGVFHPTTVNRLLERAPREPAR